MKDWPQNGVLPEADVHGDVWIARLRATHNRTTDRYRFGRIAARGRNHDPFALHESDPTVEHAPTIEDNH